MYSISNLVRRAAYSAIMFGSSAAVGQIDCQIKVFQNQQEIVSSMTGSTLKFNLMPTEFQIKVTPSGCSPSIATIPGMGIALQIMEKPLIYSQRWVYMPASNPEDSDKFLWWTRTDIDPELRKAPNPDTFQGNQYLELCDELTYCPNTYPAYSSARPFSDAPTSAQSIASFKRLDGTKTLADAKGKTFLSVIYTLWRSLPSQYPMADPMQLVFKPTLMYFTFSEAQTDASIPDAIFINAAKELRGVIKTNGEDTARSYVDQCYADANLHEKVFGEMHASCMTKDYLLTSFLALATERASWFPPYQSKNKYEVLVPAFQARVAKMHETLNTPQSSVDQARIRMFMVSSDEFKRD